MVSDTMIRDLLRSLRTTINERFAMIEDVVALTMAPASEDDKISALTDLVEQLTSRIAMLEATTLKGVADTVVVPVKETVHVNRIGTVPVVPSSPRQEAVNAVSAKDLFSSPMPNLAINLGIESVHTVNVVENADAMVEDDADADADADADVMVEDDADAEVDDADAGVEDEVEDAEDAEDADAIELEEITYKNKTYYKDPENKVYSVDENDQPSDEPIGSWDEARQRILFKR